LTRRALDLVADAPIYDAAKTGLSDLATLAANRSS
jgi:hypothetical protein